MRRLVRAYVIVPLYLLAIAGVPVATAWGLGRLVMARAGITAAILLTPPLLGILTVLCAGLMSRLTVRAIVAGKFPRDLSHPVYGPRRLYALCWTSIVYCPPIYHAVLAVPILKWMTFRLFGYKGSLDFQSYPDTWLRDLPLLTLGTGAYLSNRATVSPNMCLRDGSIVVLPIAIGARTMIGHLTMIAPGANIGADCDIGVGASVGLKVTMGDRSTLGHCAQIDHQVAIGSNCHIGARAYIGRGVVIHNGVRVPPGIVIPPRTALFTQADVASFAINSNTPIPGGMPFVAGPMSNSSIASA